MEDFSHPTPGTIAFMLACHFDPNPEASIGATHWNSVFGCSARLWLFQNHLIDHHHRATTRGMTWVEALRATPLPPIAPELGEQRSVSLPNGETAIDVFTMSGWKRVAQGHAGFRVRYHFASKPHQWNYVKDGPRKHRRFPSREDAQTFVDRQKGSDRVMLNATWEIVE